VRGIGSLSGVTLDPLAITNGYAAPGPVDGEISFVNSGGYTGMDDVPNHAARQAIEYAVARRLVDGHGDRRFRPDAALKRAELAQYLAMGASIRQSLPITGVRSFSDVSLSDPAYGYAEAAVASGAPLRDLSQQQDGVMKLSNGRFRPTDGVSRVDLAYALVQSAALQGEARAFSGPLTAFYNGSRVAVEDAATIPAAMRGYVQLALDLGLLNARFTLTQGPFDLQPKPHAWFDPNQSVTRAAYAVAAGRYHDHYLLAGD
jgi:serine protease AprX